MTQLSSTQHLNDDFYETPSQEQLPHKAERDGRILDIDTSCGIGSCRPRWLQKLVHPIPFLIVYSLLGMVQGLLWSYYVGVFTTLEKRFSYKSKITGIISLSDNFGIIVSSLVIGYFGGEGHRPRWIAAGMIVAAFGALISASPYWVFGAGTHLMLQNFDSQNDAVSTEICSPWLNGTTSFCKDIHRRKLDETIPAVCLVVLGNIVNGIGLTAFYVVGAPYLDDNIKKTLTPIYFGVMYAVRLTGPALGFFLASATLQINENLSSNVDFEPTDPRWIGAWWLGFVIIAVILIFFSVILYLFPRKIKWSDEDTMEKPVVNQMSLESKKSTKVKLKELSRVLVHLAKNKTLIFRYAGECCNLLGTLGFVLFMPKYLENQFRQGASEANKMAGFAGTMFMVVGFCISAMLIWKFKPSPRLVAAWIALTGFINAFSLIGAGSISCDNQVRSSSECGTECHCSTDLFRPVCFNNKTYFSSCYVGCKTVTHVNDTSIYSNCQCEDDNLYGTGTVETGFCPSNCNLFIYLVIIVISNLFSSSSKVGGMLITLRCVQTKHKSIALALSSILLCLFAFIPCPLMYGTIIDSACEVWEKSCGESGNCWVYDLDKFRYRLHGLSAGFILLGAIFDSIVCYYSKTIKNLYEDCEIIKETSENIGGENL